VAIVRHRLYDVDVLINRTLVYSVLTGSLAVLYWVGVALLQVLLRPVTGGSELAIVGSTLLVAAAFQPLRRRVQSTVDQRFYRRKYDVQHTLEGFSSRLRSDVDLESLSGALVRVVRDTMQPENVSLWLRPSVGRRIR
jgi:branched-subunit amino acid ABC-type transport system permease component